MDHADLAAEGHCDQRGAGGGLRPDRAGDLRRSDRRGPVVGGRRHFVIAAAILGAGRARLDRVFMIGVSIAARSCRGLSARSHLRACVGSSASAGTTTIAYRCSGRCFCSRSSSVASPCSNRRSCGPGTVSLTTPCSRPWTRRCFFGVQPWRLTHALPSPWTDVRPRPVLRLLVRAGDRAPPAVRLPAPRRRGTTFIRYLLAFRIRLDRHRQCDGLPAAGGRTVLRRVLFHPAHDARLMTLACDLAPRPPAAGRPSRPGHVDIG